MRRALTAVGVGFVSTLLACAQANAVVITTSSDPTLPISGFTTITETFDAMTVGLAPTADPSFGGATFSGSGLIAQGSNAGVSAAPFFGPAPGSADTTPYLATTGTETISFTGAPRTIFGLFWGSVDGYNTITFNGVDGPQSFTGNGIPLTANGGQFSLSSNGYVLFTGLNPFFSVTMSSTSPAFEVDNLEIAGPVSTPPVPEASTWMMMILGFFSLGFVAYRRKGSALQLRIA
jgi:hypothetical protein